MKPAVKFVLVLIPFVLLGWGVAQSVNNVDTQVLNGQSILRYGKSDFVPDWMPKSWVAKFLRSIDLDIDESLFERSLEAMSASVEASEWIKEVKRVERHFKGRFSLVLDVRKPICVLKNQGASEYLDAELNQLPLLSSQKINQLANGEWLPTIHVDAIARDSSQNRMKWCNEIINLVVGWREDPVVATRLELLDVELNPYRTNEINECCLVLKARDLKFSEDVTIDWGVNRDYNELEDRYSQDKWTDLILAIGQDRPFRALDLRYKKPEITSRGKQSLLRGR